MKRKDVPRFGCLQNLKVVVNGGAIAAPVAGGIMAENGADVIIMESPYFTDMYRGFKWAWPQERRNTRTIRANFFTPEGREIFEKMIADTDIFIESGIGGKFAQQGWTDEALWAIKKDLVIVHASGYGTPPAPGFEGLPSYDSTGLIWSGITGLHGNKGGAHIMPLGQISDFNTAYTNCWSALAAYIRAKQTGVGQSVDGAQWEATFRPLSVAVPECVNRNITGDIFRYVQDPVEAGPFFKAKDERWVYVVPNGHGKELAAYVGAADLALPEDLKIETAEWQKLYPYIAKWVAERTAEECMALRAATGATVERCIEFMDMDKINLYTERNSVIKAQDDQTVKGEVLMTGFFPHFAKNPQQLVRTGPALAADNEDIMEELGYTAEQIKELYDKGTLTVQPLPMKKKK